MQGSANMQTMTEPDDERAALENRFLRELPDAVRRDVHGQATVRTFVPGDIVAHRGDPIAEVHFPLSGAISEIEEGLDGGCAEVTIVGFEGFSGIDVLLDAPFEPFLRIVEVPTTALVVASEVLLAKRETEPALHHLVHRYAAARMRGLGISIGCYARHDVPSRLARWLLRLHDRVRSEQFELTHETMALMLGVRRPTVTAVLGELVATGAVVSARNRLRIADRKRLEQFACSCYSEARDVLNSVYRAGNANEEI